MTTNGYLLAAAVIVVWLLCAVAVVAIFHTDAANDEAWEAERPDALDTDAEWRAMVGTLDAFVAEVTASDYDPTPTFSALRDEQGLGPIFEAGYERQAKRLAAELDDATAVDRWLGRSS